MDHKQFMREAIALSRDSVHTCGGGPFGAVVVKDGQVIGRESNKVTVNNDPTAHAEIEAIRDACRNLNDFSLKGCTIYSSCEPCPMCLSAIYWARLDQVYFGNTQDDAAKIDFDDAFLYKEVALPLASRSLPIEQLLGEEAVEVFNEWDAKEDKIRY